MQLEAADIEFRELPADFSLDTGTDQLRFQVACPSCGHTSKAPGTFLGKNVRCRKCQHDFLAEWGEVVVDRAV